MLFDGKYKGKDQIHLHPSMLQDTVTFTVIFTDIDLNKIVKLFFTIDKFVTFIHNYWALMGWPANSF